MNIVAITLTIVNILAVLGLVDEIEDIKEIVEEVIDKHNETVKLTASLNKRIREIEKGDKWTKKKLKPSKIE